MIPQRRHASRSRRASDRQVLLALAETCPTTTDYLCLVTWDHVQRAVLDALANGDRRISRRSELHHQLSLYLDGGGTAEARPVARPLSRLRRYLRR